MYTYATIFFLKTDQNIWSECGKKGMDIMLIWTWKFLLVHMLCADLLNKYYMYIHWKDELCVYLNVHESESQSVDASGFFCRIERERERERERENERQRAEQTDFWGSCWGSSGRSSSTVEWCPTEPGPWRTWWSDTTTHPEVEQSTNQNLSYKTIYTNRLIIYTNWLIREGHTN